MVVARQYESDTWKRAASYYLCRKKEWVVVVQRLEFSSKLQTTSGENWDYNELPGAKSFLFIFALP